MSAALDTFFSSITSAQLEQFISDQREEDLYLEFKQKEDRRVADIGDDDRKGFSKSVSAFANADGGVLIWGVETKRSPDSPDRAHKLKPLYNAAGFRAKLQDSILNTTQPAVDDIRIEVVAGTAAGEGYVKCLIPASDRPPHRAMSAEREYWRRTSTGCRRMEHYELEDVFGRRLRPVLRVQVELTPRPDPDPHEEVRFALTNEGRGLARHAGFVCDFEGAGVSSTDGCASLTNVSNLNFRPAVCFYDAHMVVHPNGLYTSAGRAVVQRPEKGAPLRLYLTWYAENMQTRSAQVEVKPGQPRLL